MLPKQLRLFVLPFGISSARRSWSVGAKCRTSWNSPRRSKGKDVKRFLPKRKVKSVKWIFVVFLICVLFDFWFYNLLKTFINNYLFLLLCRKPWQVPMRPSRRSYRVWVANWAAGGLSVVNIFVFFCFFGGFFGQICFEYLLKGLWSFEKGWHWFRRLVWQWPHDFSSVCECLSSSNVRLVCPTLEPFYQVAWTTHGAKRPLKSRWYDPPIGITEWDTL